MWVRGVLHPGTNVISVTPPTLPFPLLPFFLFVLFCFVFFSFLFSSHLIHLFTHSLTTQITTQIGFTITNSSTSHLIHDTIRFYNHEFARNMWTRAPNIKKHLTKTTTATEPKSIKFLTCTAPSTAQAYTASAADRRPRPHALQAVPAPRRGGPSMPAQSKSWRKKRERWEWEEIRMGEGVGMDPKHLNGVID
jgi:hypothetical protein